METTIVKLTDLHGDALYVNLAQVHTFFRAGDSTTIAFGQPTQQHREVVYVREDPEEVLRLSRSHWG